MKTIPIIPRELILAIDMDRRRRDHIVAARIARHGRNEIQAGLSDFQALILFLRVGEFPLATLLLDFCRRQRRLPDELHLRLAAEIFRIIRFFHAVGLPFDAREFHIRLHRLQHRRAIVANGDELNRQRLSLAHHIGHPAQTEVKLRTVRGKFRALRNRLLIEIRDLRSEAHLPWLRQFRVARHVERHFRHATRSDVHFPLRGESRRATQFLFEPVIVERIGKHELLESLGRKFFVAGTHAPRELRLRERLAHVVFRRDGHLQRRGQCGRFGRGHFYLKRIRLVFLHTPAVADRAPVLVPVAFAENQQRTVVARDIGRHDVGGIERAEFTQRHRLFAEQSSTRPFHA